MSMLFWNVRGMNKKGRRKDIKNHINKYHLSVIGLLETKVKSSKAERITGCIPSTWSYCANYEFSNKGRIWVFWDEAIWTGSVVSTSLQQITIKMQNKI